MTVFLARAHLPALFRSVPSLAGRVSIEGQEVFGVEVSGETVIIQSSLAVEFATEIAEVAAMSAKDLADADLALQKIAARKAVVARANSFTAPILSRYPEAERAGWFKREAEARAIVAAGDKAAAIATTSVIKVIAIAADETTAETVARAQAIIAKADEFAEISAAVEIMRDIALAAIEDVEDAADMPATLELLKTQATTIAADYGLHEHA